VFFAHTNERHCEHSTVRVKRQKFVATVRTEAKKAGSKLCNLVVSIQLLDVAGRPQLEPKRLDRKPTLLRTNPSAITEVFLRELHVVAERPRSGAPDP
jgi:hypothetical protein